MLHRYLKAGWLLIGAGVLAGCQTVVQVDRSAFEANKSMASYNAASSLLNVVRASKNEPPVFAPITGLTGHNTLSGTLTLPSVTVGGANPTSAVFGSNSTTRSVSADFNVNPPDDAQVSKALSTPLDPGTLGLLEGQGFQRDLLLYLFVDEIRVERQGLKTLIFVSDPFHQVVSPTTSNSTIVGELDSGKWAPQFAGQPEFEAFGALLDAMMSQGLMFQVDRQGFSSGGPRPTARTCFDDAHGMKIASESATEPGHQDVVDATNRVIADLALRKVLGDCADDWPSDAATAAAPAKPAAPTPAQPIDRLADAVATALNGPKPKPTKNDSFWSYGDDHNRVRLHTRSIASAYQFLGALQRNATLLRVTRTPDQSAKVPMLQITDATKGCFTGFIYEGRPWCVPEDPSSAPGLAYPAPTSATKQTLALLHATLELYLSAQNSTTTATTRSIP